MWASHLGKQAGKQGGKSPSSWQGASNVQTELRLEQRRKKRACEPALLACLRSLLAFTMRLGSVSCLLCEVFTQGLLTWLESAPLAALTVEHRLRSWSGIPIAVRTSSRARGRAEQ